MATSAEALASLTNFNKTRKDAKTAQSEAEAKYGVSDLATRVKDLRSLTNNLTLSVEGVDKSVTGRTGGSFVTEAQRSAIVNRERQPILGELSKQQSALGEEQWALTNAQSLAGQMASNIVSSDTQRYQSLLDQYNVAVQQEREAEERRRWEEENRRWWTEFNARQKELERSMSAYRSAYSGAMSGGGSSGGGGAKMSQRGDKGFNFTDASGNAISAASYSKLKGIPFRQLLQQMANAGDRGAQVGLELFGDDYGVNKAKLNRGFDMPWISFAPGGALKYVNSLAW